MAFVSSLSPEAAVRVGVFYDPMDLAETAVALRAEGYQLIEMGVTLHRNPWAWLFFGGGLPHRTVYHVIWERMEDAMPEELEGAG